MLNISWQHHAIIKRLLTVFASCGRNNRPRLPKYPITRWERLTQRMPAPTGSFFTTFFFGSQINAAVNFIKGLAGQVSPVTLDIGDWLTSEKSAQREGLARVGATEGIPQVT